MIRYTLSCDHDHQFDSWFQSSAAFDAVSSAGHLSCPICGSDAIERALMAPSVHHTAARQSAPKPDLKSPQSDAEIAVDKIRRHIEANSDDVGPNFATEARKMHDGVTPERAIYGTAGAEDAKKLVEDGVPVVPLPFMPKRNAN